MCVNCDFRAKELFFKYGGSHFHMEREGEYSKYRGYNISREQEYKWIKEYQGDLLERIKNEKIVSGNFYSLCASIEEYGSLNSLKELVIVTKDKSEVLDTFSLLLSTEAILRVVDSIKDDFRGKDILNFAKDVSLDILKSLLIRPVTVAVSYFSTVSLIDLHNEQAILDRIKEELDTWC